MGYTKITKPITINAASGDVVFDGFDFTETGFITVSDAKSITVRNSRIYNLQITDKKDWMTVTGSTPVKIVVEDNFFGMVSGMESSVKVSGKVADATSVSKNYFKENSFSKEGIGIYDADSAANVTINANTFEKGEFAIKLSPKGDPNCNITMMGNTLKSLSGDNPIMQSLIRVQPNKKETTTFENMVVSLSNNTVDSKYQMIVYCAADDTALSTSQVPKVTLDGESYVVPIIKDDTIAVVDGIAYSTVNEAVEAAATSGKELVLYKNITEAITIAPGKTVTITGITKDINLSKGIVLTGTGSENINVTLKSLTIDGSEFGIRSQNQTAQNQLEANITIDDCVIKNHSSKGIYMTNAKNIKVMNTEFIDCATGPMDKPNTKGDYAFDLNLVAVQDSDILIEGCSFTGSCGKKSAVKVTQRCGASDAGASDMPKGVPEAKVKQLVVRNCAFNTTDSEADVRIGTDSKTPGAENTTGNYPVLIEGCSTDVRVSLAYSDVEFVTTVPVGSIGKQESDDDFTVDDQSVAPIENGVKKYYSLEKALKEATSGNIITLNDDITCNNTKVSAPANNPIFLLTNGVTLDGKNHKIIADSETWVDTNKNHILGIVDGTTSVKNITLEGNAKTKSGFVAYGTNVVVEINNVEINNCGNCGMQIVNGANVTIDGYRSTGNAWGSINADKGAGGNNPTVKYNSGTMAENVEIYTEVLDSTIVTAPTLTEVIGVGDKLKGFKYFTSNKKRLGVAAVTVDGVTTVYENLEEAQAAASEAGVEVEIL